MVALAEITRRPTKRVYVGKVAIGGGAPVVVQSMTDTDTADSKATARQIIALAKAGSELVRITVNNEAAAAAVPEILSIITGEGFGDVPIVGDFHYNGHTLLRKYPKCAEALAKYRINPGNVGAGEKHDPRLQEIVQVAIDHEKPVRIGVNWGSLDQDLAVQLMDKNAKLASPRAADEVLREALVISAISSANKAVEYGLNPDRICVSCKVSRVQDLVVVYRELARQCDYALHLGLTEAGMGSKGIVASSAALAILLQEGIGDTIRISLTPRPGAAREEEVIVGQEILQSLGIRSFAPMVSSCPGCGRTTSSFFRELAEKIQHFIRAQMPVWKVAYPGVESLNIAVMGCIVNGPGESKHSDIGISLPGSGESPVAPVFIDGEKKHTLRGDTIAEDFQRILCEYVERRFGAR